MSTLNMALLSIILTVAHMMPHFIQLQTQKAPQTPLKALQLSLKSLQYGSTIHYMEVSINWAPNWTPICYDPSYQGSQKEGPDCRNLPNGD